MFVQDKIADMLTRIRNANIMRYQTVEVIGTKMTLGIAEILKKEGSDETIRVSSEKRNKLAEIASARLKARRELEQARKKIQRKREEEKGI